ncbi:MAG: DUF1573 domain-containing protein [Planctomycetes bacterium]|nr:DUF1573 domain-containing protein [Planctomycetota bacterium]
MPNRLISSLMLAALSSLVAIAGAAEQLPRIEITGDPAAEPVETDVDFGLVRANETFPVSWLVVNETDRVLVLGDLKSSCPCLSAISLSTRRLAPKEETTVSARWYVGPAHGTETLRVTIPLSAADMPAGVITINATVSVTDLIDIDEGARVIALGKFTVETLDAAAIPPVAFRKTTFRAWDEVFVKTNDTFASIAIEKAEPGAYEITFTGVAPERLAARPLGVFSDDFTLGFRKDGSDLEDTVRYRMAGHFSHPRYALSPPQLYWGPMSGDDGSTDDQRQTARRAGVVGFTPTVVTHQRTTFVFNGLESRDAADPFQVTAEGTGLEVRLAATPTAMPKYCDKGCAVYLVEGTDEGKAVQYLFPVFFSIPE